MYLGEFKGRTSPTGPPLTKQKKKPQKKGKT